MPIMKRALVFIISLDYSMEFTDLRAACLTVVSALLLTAVIALLFLFIKNKRISNDYKKQSIMLSTIFKTIPDMLYCKDLSCTYTMCNSGFEELAGCEERELIGKNALELLTADPEMAKKMMEIDRTVIETCSKTVVVEWLTYPDGTKKLFETIKTPITQNGKTTGMVGISRDITVLESAVEKAMTAAKTKSTFLAHISHEIRTPMNAISSMAELILRDNITQTAYENALSIKQASNNLLSVVNNILDFSKIEASRIEIIQTEYSFVSLINDVISIIRMRSIEKSLMFTVNIDSRIPGKLTGDETKIRQILLNLLENAVKYTHEGFISLSITGQIEDNTVLLTTDVSDSGIGVRKEDIDQLFFDFVQLDKLKNRHTHGTGLGLAISKNLGQAMGGDISLHSEYGVGSTFTFTIPQAFNAYERFASVNAFETKSVLLFDPRPLYADSILRSIHDLGVKCTHVEVLAEFFRELEQASYTHVFASVFLHREIKEAIDSHMPDTKLVLLYEHGDILPIENVRSLSLPAHSGSIANTLNDTISDICYYKRGESGSFFTAPTARILIVDDVSTNLKVCTSLIQPYKVITDTCKSGTEAIHLVQRFRYDIIFMDHLMPEMDGVETAKRIRNLDDKSGYYKSVPIIALTANAVSGTKESFLFDGMNDFLTKPIEISALNAILEKWIPKEKQEPSVGRTEDTVPKVAKILEIEGVDTAAGIAMSAGSTDSYLKTLTVFYEEGFVKIKKIRDCLEQNDAKLYTTFLHALKGSAASIGAMSISNYARLLEDSGKQGDLSLVQGNTEDFLSALKVLLQNIKAALPNEPSTSGEAVHYGFEEELTKLKNALTAMNVAEVDIAIDRLKSIRRDEETEDTIRNISSCILLFDYGEAAELVDGLLAHFKE